MFYTQQEFNAFTKENYKAFIKKEMTLKCMEQMNMFKHKLVYENNYFNIKNLLDEGVIILKRKNND